MKNALKVGWVERSETQHLRLGEDFQKNWVYFPQFTTVSHEFRAEKVGGEESQKEFVLYSCRIVVRPNIETNRESE